MIGEKWIRKDVERSGCGLILRYYTVICMEGLRKPWISTIRLAGLSHKSPPVIPILSQINLVSTLSYYFSTLYFNIILPSTTKSSKHSFLKFFRIIFCMQFSLCATYSGPYHPLYFKILTISDNYKMKCSSLSKFIQTSDVSCLWYPKILLVTFYSKTYSSVLFTETEQSSFIYPYSRKF
jgi:hypothetical protein